MGRYEIADHLDQHVIDHWPGGDQSFWAQMDMAKTNVILGNDVAVQSAIDNLISTYSNHSSLPSAIFQIGEQYYNKAFQFENESREAEAKEHFRKAIMVFEKMITEFPPNATYTGYAYYLLADCYQRFGDKYCGAYVVWHTLHYYGLAKSIDAITNEMQIEKKRAISIYEVVQALITNGISAHAVKLDLKKTGTIDRPFIQYIAPMTGGQFGHFVLCIPTGSGKAVALDGAEEPKVIDLVFSEQDTYQQTRWDGTSILIDGTTKENGGNLTSGLLNLNIMSELAASWLETEGNEHWLTLYMQVALSGGCPDDCKNIGRNCWTDPSCKTDDNCAAGNYCCGDKTEEQKCQTPGSLPYCAYDSNHTCSPKKQLTGSCGSGPYCGLWSGNYGACYPSKQITQCHN